MYLFTAVVHFIVPGRTSVVLILVVSAVVSARDMFAGADELVPTVLPKERFLHHVENCLMMFRSITHMCLCVTVDVWTGQTEQV